ncbi:MAG TPA: amidohydrolase family protein [Acidimicrobiales bacterium]|nr:amidohydrolase family protein [Acidimicrobiales bacterium]
MTSIADDVKVIDCDTHLTEAADLWTSRAPDAYKDRVPRIEQVDGRDHWVVDGEVIGFAGGGGVINNREEKHPFLSSMLEWGRDTIHPAAFDIDARLKVMDECGVHAQLTFPNSIGLGGENLAGNSDERFRLLCVQIFNDAAAEYFEQTGGRIVSMPIMPAWSVDACVEEAKRVAAQGARGVNMTSDPSDQGAPDLANPAWDPFWEVCEAEHLPVHFHIGASLTAMNFYSKYFWESQDEFVKPAIGGSMLFINSARVLLNINLAGMLDRFPELQFVAVESGIGYIPFMLETMDYEVWENAPEQFSKYELKPSEYFARNWHATFWFERHFDDLQGLVDKVGDTNILWETDFPHPTCLYPNPLGEMEDKMATLRPESRRRILGENAAKLYRL